MLATFTTLLCIFGTTLGLAPPNHVEMERLKPRAEFVRLNRAHPSLDHEVVVAVQQRNLDELERTVLERSTPGSRTYQSWMTFEQVGALTSNEAGADAIRTWLTESGATVTWSSVHHDYIKATAPISIWESMLHTEFHMWKDTTVSTAKHQHHRGHTEAIPRADTYFLPEAMRSHVFGMFHVSHLPPKVYSGGHRMKAFKSTSSIAENRHLRSNQHKTEAADSHALRRLGTTVESDSTPQFLASLYNISNTTGSPMMTQAVFETAEEGYSQEDLTTFQQLFNLTLQDALDVGGYNISSTDCGTSGSCYEGNLDIQYIMGMAQQVVSYYWYVPGNDPFTDFVTDISDAANPPLVNSISWGSVEQYNSPTSMSAFNTEAMKVAAMGVTIMVSSGDNGVVGNQCNDGQGCSTDSGSSDSFWTGSNTWSGEGYFPSFPASSPYVTAVGGSMGPNFGDPEVVCTASGGGVITSGGGFSTYYPAPDWQASAVSNYFATVSPQPAPGYNIAGRAYPDVSMLATYYPIVNGGEVIDLFGTSASSPLFASMISLLNSERMANGLPTVGWINPTLYSAASTYYTDITSGNNTCCVQGDPVTYCCEAGFTATTGWDPATGFGSITYPNLTAMFGTTTNNMPTLQTTAAPTYAPTIGPMTPGYFMLEESNSPTCESATLENDVQVYFQEGQLTGACVAYNPAAEGVANQSYIAQVFESDLAFFATYYVYRDSTDCTGNYTAELGGSITNECYDVSAQTGVPTYLRYYLLTNVEPWTNNTADGLVSTKYDNASQCTEETAWPASFEWVATGYCLPGANISITCNPDGGANYSFYDNEDCTGAPVMQFPIPEQTCAADGSSDDDDDSRDDDYYHTDYPKVSSTFCYYAGLTGRPSNLPTMMPSFAPTLTYGPTSAPTQFDEPASNDDDSNSTLSGGAITGIVFACIFGLVAMYFAAYFLYSYLNGLGRFASSSGKSGGDPFSDEAMRSSSAKKSMASQDLLSSGSQL